MDNAERRLALVRGIAAETIGEAELVQAFDEGRRLTAYDGFEPSGPAHVPFAILRSLNIQALLAAGIDFVLLLADSFALINGKLGGNLDQIRLAGTYYMEVWRAAGVPMDRVRTVWHTELFEQPSYWRRVLQIANNHSVQRTVRSLAIAGRQGSDSNPTSYLFYPSMQCADIFELDVDICQLGLDQRKVNMLAREIAGKMGWKKPICVHHELLPALQPAAETGAFDEDAAVNARITSKMSKSRPEGAIFVHDSERAITEKLRKAYCPAGQVENNPVLEYARQIVLRRTGRLLVERESRHGGDVEYQTHGDLAADFAAGRLHPSDLKLAVARGLEDAVRPIREHFESNGHARGLLEELLKAKVTR